MNAHKQEALNPTAQAAPFRSGIASKIQFTIKPFREFPEEFQRSYYDHLSAGTFFPACTSKVPAARITKRTKFAACKPVTFLIWSHAKQRKVKITMLPGEKWKDGYHSKHEEGYSSQGQVIEYDGEYLYCDEYESSRDCDGSHGSESRYIALPALEPKWETLKSGVYDQFAEMAGY